MTESVERTVSEVGTPIGKRGRSSGSHERTNELTKKNLRSDKSSSSDTPAGGLKNFAPGVELPDFNELIEPAVRAQVIRTGDREPISKMVRSLVYRRDGGQCKRCGKRPWARRPQDRSGELHLDHIVPWSAGGSDRTDNLRILCHKCNRERSNFVRKSDAPELPIVRICAPCLACTDPRIEHALTFPQETFTVYCGARDHVSWAIPGWRIL